MMCLMTSLGGVIFGKWWISVRRPCSYGEILTLIDYLLGNSLLKNMAAAIPQAIFHRRAFEEFDEHLRHDMPEQVKKWDEQYAEWDRKPTASPCLFDTTERRKLLLRYRPHIAHCSRAAISMAKIKLQLANEEAAKAGLETCTALTPSSFILFLLEVEDLQYVLI